VVATLVIVTVASTPHTRIEDKARKVAPHDSFDVAHTSSYNFDTTTLQLTQSAIAHTTREHHLDPQLLKVISNTRLTTTPLRRGQLLARNNLFIFNIEDRIMIAMTEVVIHTTVTCWNSYFHILKF
jgi:hypothetical protein